MVFIVDDSSTGDLARHRSATRGHFGAHQVTQPTYDTGVDGTFIWTPSHDQRPCSFSTALLRGCDPCQPGAAVQVRRPQRSEDEQPWTVGGHLMRPPRSRNVAERRAAAAPDPPF